MKKILDYSKNLKEVGLTRDQAEVHLRILSEVVEDEMATKTDIVELRQATKSDLEQLELRMTIRLGTMMVLSMGVLFTLLKLT